ncbi:hypothetical protein [Lentzea sp. CC55]|uniref:hypothetical protein n=1 Tax=Lentzea sp. CC55 TaxID=2884909 RepID=UPI001F387DF9|nr:hypothetical protein [Lentzea sp. CC55]MCG8927925.1 hypothetical protein [Lentzea sp. CC55]
MAREETAADASQDRVPAPVTSRQPQGRQVFLELFLDFRRAGLGGDEFVEAGVGGRDRAACSVALRPVTSGRSNMRVVLTVSGSHVEERGRPGPPGWSSVAPTVEGRG